MLKFFISFQDNINIIYAVLAWIILVLAGHFLFIVTDDIGQDLVNVLGLTNFNPEIAKIFFAGIYLLIFGIFNFIVINMIRQR